MVNNDRDISLFGFLVLCWNGCGRLLKQLGTACMQATRLAIQYYWVMLATIALAIGVAARWSKPDVGYFRGDATILFTEGMSGTVTDGIKMFFSGLQITGAPYGITKEQALAVRSVKIKNVIDSKHDSIPDYVDMRDKIEYKDTVDVVMKDRLHLIMKLKNSVDFKLYQNALASYMRDNEMVASTDRYYKEAARMQLDYAEREVARLDSFADFEYFRKPRDLRIDHWGPGLITERDQDLRHADLFSMINKRNYLKTHIERTPDVINFQSDFIVSTLSRAWKFVICMAAGVAVGLLISLLIKYWNRVTDYIKER